MRVWPRAFPLALFLLTCFGGHTPARAQQFPGSRVVLLVNLIKNADEILVFQRDSKVPSGWRRQPTLHLTAARDAKLFRALREAPVTKPMGLSASDASWRFDFIEKHVTPKKLGAAVSDGKILERKGDASITLPAEWLEKMK